MSLAVRRALHGKLSGDSTLNALLGTPASGYSKAIYYQQAPKGAAFPFVIFSKQAGTPRYTLGTRAYDNDVWLIKGVAHEGDADPIADRLDALLTDGTISISGRTQLYLRRESDVDYAETVDGEVYRHAGSNFRLMYA